MKTKTITARENYLRALEFRYPAWIPVSVDLVLPAWTRYGRDLEDLVLSHPRIFPDYRLGTYPTQPEDPFFAVYEEQVDDWGCVWRNTEAGFLGQVVGHPLADWSAFNTFNAPERRCVAPARITVFQRR